MSRKHRKPVSFVVSNRLPVRVRPTDVNTYDISPSSGGLVGALHGFAGSTEFRWYGWPGIEIPEQHRATVEEQLETQKAYPVFFDKSLADKHYNGCSSSYGPLSCSSGLFPFFDTVPLKKDTNIRRVLHRRLEIDFQPAYITCVMAALLKQLSREAQPGDQSTRGIVATLATCGNE